jgi:uncharacterized protein YuzE
MRVRYDRSVDMAYIALTEIKPAEAAIQEVFHGNSVEAKLVLDFDRRGRLLGIEVFEASRVLPEEVLTGTDSS